MKYITIKKLSKLNGLADTVLTTAYHTLHHIKHHHMAALGGLPLLFIPILDIIKAVTYYNKMQVPEYNRVKGGAYTGLTAGMHILKAMATTIGLMAFLMGSVTIGFAILIGANAWMSLRSAGKAAQALYEGNYRQALNHTQKFVINAAYTAAFALIAFFPPLSTIAWGLALGASVIAIFGASYAGDKEHNTKFEFSEDAQQNEANSARSATESLNRNSSAPGTPVLFFLSSSNNSGGVDSNVPPKNNKLTCP